jgi:hypothetical protein
MKPIFKPSDFKTEYPNLTCDDVAKIANAKLEKLIESWPVVYAHAGPSTFYLENPVWISKGRHDADSTHQARLAFIEPIKRDCVKHEAIKVRLEFGGVPIAKCKHCDIELVAEWKEKT